MIKTPNPVIAPVLYIFTIVYMMLIFYGSSLTSLDQPGPLEKIPDVDKLEHSIEFFVLGLLLFLSCHFTVSAKVRQHAWAMALLVGIIYAISDEVHQIFVPNRSADLLDLLVDTAGISVAAMVGIWISQRRAGSGALVRSRPVTLKDRMVDSEE